MNSEQKQKNSLRLGKEFQRKLKFYNFIKVIELFKIREFQFPP